MVSRWLPRLAVPVAATAFVLALSGPAWAGTVATWGWAAALTTTATLSEAHEGSTAAGFTKQDCTGPFADLADDTDGWHFLFSDGDDFVSVSLTFQKPGGSTENVLVNSTAAGSPSTDVDGEWYGYIDDAGGSGQSKHMYLFTNAGWILQGGTAIVDGTTSQNPTFNLSHTCAGSVIVTPSPSPSSTGTPQPSGSVSEHAFPSTSSPGIPPTSATQPDDPGLPVTGTKLTAIILTGAGLIAGGAALVVARRRRDQLALAGVAAAVPDLPAPAKPPVLDTGAGHADIT